jgi:CHAD domain-containing protein
VGQLADQRAAAQPAIERMARRCLKEDRYLRKVYLLLAGIGPRDKSCKGRQQCVFRQWAHGRLDEVAAETFAALPTATSDAGTLHQFRIRIKALRYAIELLAPALGADLREVQYPIVEQIQGRLGRINDHAAGAARLETWSGAAADPQTKELLDALVQQERIRLAEAIAEFRQWWTPERVAQLRTGLAAESA